MGYVVESIAMIGADDPHGYFAFFVPSPWTEFGWINRYFRDHFFEIAEALGSQGVIVTSQRLARDVVAEFSDLVENQKIRAADISGERLMDCGVPLLVVTRYPIAALGAKTHGAEANCVALNLGGVRDEKELGAVIDHVIKAGERDGDDILPAIRPLGKQLKGNNWGRFADDATAVVNYEPSLMGVKINLAELIKVFNKRRRIKI
jgi:hypothetical protein